MKYLFLFASLFSGLLHAQDVSIFAVDGLVYLRTESVEENDTMVTITELGDTTDAIFAIEAIDRPFRNQRTRLVRRLFDGDYDRLHSDYIDLLEELNFNPDSSYTASYFNGMFTTDTVQLLVPASIIPAADLIDFTDEVNPSGTVSTSVYFAFNNSGTLRMRAVAPATGNWKVVAESPSDFTVSNFLGGNTNFFLQLEKDRRNGTLKIYRQYVLPRGPHARIRVTQ